MKREFDNSQAREFLYYLQGELETAYQLSGGMGIYSESVEKFFQGKNLSSDDEGNIINYQADYLTSFYESVNPNTPQYVVTIPEHKNPRWEHQKDMGLKTLNAHTNVGRKQISLLLSGETTHQENKYTHKEFSQLLIFAEKRGLLKVIKKDLSKIKLPNNLLEILSIDYNTIMSTTQDFFPEILKVRHLSPTVFKNEFTEATTLKLASMLAVTDQLTFEAMMYNHPVSYNWTPSDPVTIDCWQRDIGSNIPPLGDFYKKTYKVLSSSPCFNQDIIQKSILPSLPQLTPPDVNL